MHVAYMQYCKFGDGYQCHGKILQESSANPIHVFIMHSRSLYSCSFLLIMDFKPPKQFQQVKIQTPVVVKLNWCLLPASLSALFSAAVFQVHILQGLHRGAQQLLVQPLMGGVPHGFHLD